uniref:Uncharacterized protein n=1 Tax=Oryza nivara TaxID=4536 RepID=A0A0E0GGW0_ORYNI
MESGTRDVSDSNAIDLVQDQRAGAVDPVVAIDPVSVEAAAIYHAVIIVDAGQTRCCQNLVKRDTCYQNLNCIKSFLSETYYKISTSVSISEHDSIAYQLGGPATASSRLGGDAVAAASGDGGRAEDGGHMKQGGFA